MAAKKTAAKKRGPGRPKGSKTTRRRKSTAEPKTIIRRKKAAGKKTTAKRTGRKAAGATKAVDRLEAANKQGAQLVDLISKQGKSLDAAATKLGISKGKARRLYLRASVKGKDKIVGTDAEITKKVLAARDDGVSWPELSARTGKSVKSLKNLVGDGATTKRAKRGRKAKAADDEDAPRTKRGRKTGKAKAVRGKKTAAAPKKAARGRKAKRAAAVEAANESNAGLPKGRRARRAHLREVLADVVWNLDTDNDAVADLLTGRTIEVSRTVDGRAMRPTDHQIVTVQKVELHDREGRLIRFTDENKQTRYVASREITALK